MSGVKARQAVKKCSEDGFPKLIPELYINHRIENYESYLLGKPETTNTLH